MTYLADKIREAFKNEDLPGLEKLIESNPANPLDNGSIRLPPEWVLADGDSPPEGNPYRRVEVIFRNFHMNTTNVIGRWDWRHYGGDGDILAYKLLG